MQTEPLVLVPFDIRESMSISAAAKHSGKASNTIRLWAEQHGVGRKIGGAWHISRVALQMFLDGNQKALDAYHAGDRSHVIVRSYFEMTGCAALLQKAQSRQFSPHLSGDVGPSWSQIKEIKAAL